MVEWLAFPSHTTAMPGHQQAPASDGGTQTLCKGRGKMRESVQKHERSFIPSWTPSVRCFWIAMTTDRPLIIKQLLLQVKTLKES